MFAQQPMKMAAAEALYETSQAGAVLDSSRSARSTAGPDLVPRRPQSAVLPRDRRLERRGARDQRPPAQYQQQFGPGDYRPSIPVAFWSFRLMIGFGLAAAAFALLVWWLVRRGRAPTSRWVLLAAGVVPLLPAAGQLVRLDLHRDRPPALGGVRADADQRRGQPPVTPGQIWTSLITFTLLYGVLAVDRGGAAAASDASSGPSPRRRRRPVTPPTTVPSRSPTEEPAMGLGTLQTIWFVLIAMLWTGYFVLEGFDFGVGVLLRVLGRDEAERRTLLSTRSARSGTATRCGSSSRAARRSPPSRTGTRRCSAGSTCRCC